MTMHAIKAAIPHREPFLLLDEIVEQTDDRIVCRKTFTGDEFWYRGHYPHAPITPGVLLCESAMQAGAVLLAKKAAETFSAESATSPHSAAQAPVATRINNVQFKQMVLPGDVVDIDVAFVEQLANAYFLKARVTVGGKIACRFDFACTLASVAE